MKERYQHIWLLPRAIYFPGLCKPSALWKCLKLDKHHESWIMIMFCHWIGFEESYKVYHHCSREERVSSIPSAILIRSNPCQGSSYLQTDFPLAKPFSREASTQPSHCWAQFSWRSGHHLTESSLWVQHMPTWHFAKKSHKEDCCLQYNTPSIIPSV